MKGCLEPAVVLKLRTPNRRRIFNQLSRSVVLMSSKQGDDCSGCPDNAGRRSVPCSPAPDQARDNRPAVPPPSAAKQAVCRHKDTTRGRAFPVPRCFQWLGLSLETTRNQVYQGTTFFTKSCIVYIQGFPILALIKHQHNRQSVSRSRNRTGGLTTWAFEK